MKWQFCVNLENDRKWNRRGTAINQRIIAWKFQGKPAAQFDVCRHEVLYSATKTEVHCIKIYLERNRHKYLIAIRQIIKVLHGNLPRVNECIFCV